MERAFGQLMLWSAVSKERVNGIRGFTLLNMHAAKGAFPWVGCKGADSIVLLKFLVFFSGLQLNQGGWTFRERQALKWIQDGSKAGLQFSQGIHGHGIWLPPSCSLFLRKAIHKFGACYSLLAKHSLDHGYSLFGMIPKLHALMHFKPDLDTALRGDRYAISPATFDTSMCEDFIGRISRHSRRISYRNLERGVLFAWQVKTKLMIDKFQKRGK